MTLFAILITLLEEDPEYSGRLSDVVGIEGDNGHAVLTCVYNLCTLAAHMDHTPTLNNRSFVADNLMNSIRLKRSQWLTSLN